MMLLVKWYFAKRDFTCFTKVFPSVLGASKKPIITWQGTHLSLINLIPNVKKLKHPHIKCGSGCCKLCNGRKHTYCSSFFVNMVGMCVANNLFIIYGYHILSQCCITKNRNRCVFHEWHGDGPCNVNISM
jgi:hypothetical protein